jgi:hypothetical protein
MTEKARFHVFRLFMIGPVKPKKLSTSCSQFMIPEKRFFCFLLSVKYGNYHFTPAALHYARRFFCKRLFVMNLHFFSVADIL